MSDAALPDGPWTRDQGTREQGPMHEMPSAATPTPVDIRWEGRPGALAGLGLTNFLLTVVTLGTYSFWGKTEVRRRIWSSVRLLGEPLRYTGTGKELFVGFLVVFSAVLLPFLLITIALVLLLGPESAVAEYVQLGFYVVLPFLIALASYRARRYRLSRTTWRGIRGAMVGSSLRYAVISYASLLLLPLTLGWAAPWRSMMLQRRLTRETTLGDRPLGFDGGAGPLYGRFAGLWIGSIVLYISAIGMLFYIFLDKILAAVDDEGRLRLPLQALTTREIAIIVAVVLGSGLMWMVISAWYRAGLANHIARSTTYEGARFSLDLRAGRLVWLFITNLLLIILTLGILKPVAEARSARYVVDRLRLEGKIALGAIAQSTAASGRGGEGLAQAFDVDGF